MTSHAFDLTTALRELVARRRRPYEVVLHLGAGSDAAEVHASTMPTRLILVEGDPEVASDLRARLHGAGLVAEIHPSVVTAMGGPAQWHRYNLRALSGPRDAMRWRSWYPRLRELGTFPVASVGVAALVDSVVPAVGTDDLHVAADRLLLLDLPGQEQDIVGSLSGGMLRRFSTIVVLRGPERMQIAADADRIEQHMASAGFAQRPGDADPSAPFSYQLYQLDARREHQLRLTEERDLALARVSQLETEAADLKRRHDALQAQLKALDPAARKAEIDALSKSLDEERKTSRARAQRIEQLEAELMEAQIRAELMQQELLKAEGQLDVVKDLLLADPTL